MNQRMLAAGLLALSAFSDRLHDRPLPEVNSNKGRRVEVRARHPQPHAGSGQDVQDHELLTSASQVSIPISRARTRSVNFAGFPLFTSDAGSTTDVCADVGTRRHSVDGTSTKLRIHIAAKECENQRTAHSLFWAVYRELFLGTRLGRVFWAS